GPLGDGHLDGDYIVCPWHNWKFHCVTGEGEPGFEQDRVPRFEVTVEDGRVLLNPVAVTKRHKAPHERHPLARPVVRAAGPLRVLGISTTNMDVEHRRYSTSEDLLVTALDHAKGNGAETQIVRLHELTFRACEGYYSKSAHACTWPCSITQMDPDDQLDRVYEGLVHWADVVLVATPIRWGNASSLYYKMIERLNCVQNQMTIRNTALIRNKVASFVITGGQDNVQAVAGQAMMFFGELGFQFPPFPFIAHSRGWDAEDMEGNTRVVRNSTVLHDGARALVDRAMGTAAALLEHATEARQFTRAGRKAYGAGRET
ncbi:MAG: NAD(P)H-dependent oxidoreductase, partial [Gemmatimonadales bacterium]